VVSVGPDLFSKPMSTTTRTGDACGQGWAKDDRGRSSLETLLEYASCRGVALRVDRERSVISGVKILGLESANGRSYSPRALADARSLYEGCPVNIDHVDGPRRSYRDRIGRLTAVALRADGLYGNLVVNPKHPLKDSYSAARSIELPIPPPACVMGQILRLDSRAVRPSCPAVVCDGKQPRPVPGNK